MREMTERVLLPAVADPRASHAGANESVVTQADLRVLLVESDDDLGRSRMLLLQSLGWPVDVARDRPALCAIPREARYGLVAVGMRPRLMNIPLILTTIRNLWPTARILLLGNSAVGIEDHQYDEMVDADHHPGNLVDIAGQLLLTYVSASRL